MSKTDYNVQAELWKIINNINELSEQYKAVSESHKAYSDGDSQNRVIGNSLGNVATLLEGVVDMINEFDHAADSISLSKDRRFDDLEFSERDSDFTIKEYEESLSVEVRLTKSSILTGLTFRVDASPESIDFFVMKNMVESEVFFVNVDINDRSVVGSNPFESLSGMETQELYEVMKRLFDIFKQKYYEAA